jgi:hypothetical protein
MRNVLQITLSLVLLATLAGAQSPEQSWDNLRSLGIGEKIQVVDQKLKSQNGTFVSFSEEAITFQAGQGEVTVERSDVFRVSSRERGRSRGRNALRGFLVGGGIGLGIGVAMLASGALDVPTGEALLGTLVQAPLSFGLPGAGIGAALPPGHPTIYRAERRKDQTAP